MDGQKASQSLKGSKPGRKINRANMHGNIVAIFKAFMGGPASVRQLSDKTGIYYDTMTSVVKALHNGGVIYIARWDVDTIGRYQIARYAYGHGVDAIRPKKKTASERNKKHRAKKLKNQEKPLQTNTFPRVSNDSIDNVFRMWGNAA